MTDERYRIGLSKSICEEALYEFGRSDDSLAGMIEQYDIRVRDFMLLSLVCDQDCFELDQLGRALGLDRQEVENSASQLIAAGLLRKDDEAAANRDERVCASDAGRRLSSRILRSISGDD